MGFQPLRLGAYFRQRPVEPGVRVIMEQQQQLTTLWQSVRQSMRMNLAVMSYRQWIDGLVPVTIDNNVLVVECPSESVRETVTQYYMDNLMESARRANPRIAGILLTLPSQRNDFAPKPEPASTSPYSLNHRYTFDTFVVGNSNRYAHAACLAVADKPGAAYNPLFLYGGVGLGKTHLMHAIGHEVRRKNPMARVLYTTSESFTNDLIECIRLNKTPEFRQKYRSLDVLMIDDIQFIAQKDSVQEEFFNTFNTLHNAGKQIVVCSDRPPKELATLEERLRSRFEWGLIADIQKPDLETRIAILRNRIQQDNLKVDDRIVEYIAENVQDSIRELEGSLQRVLFFASISKQPLNMELAQEALKDIIPVQKKQAVTPERIQEVVAEYYNLSVETLLSPRRDKAVATARHVAIYLCHDMLSLPYKNISALFKRGDHTTAMNSCTKVEEMLEKDDMFRRTMADIKSRLV